MQGEIRMINYYMIIVYSLLALLLTYAKAGTISSNIPVIVSPIKNYTTAEPQWLTSPFFRAGNEAVIRTLTGNNTTPTYTFTFSSALPGLPNLAYGIKNYRGNDWLGQEFYEIKKIGLTPATFRVSIQIYGVTNLWLLTVAYLAVDPTFPHHLNSFDNVPINYTAGNIVNITTQKKQLAYYTNYINYTKQAQGMAYTKFTNPLSSNNIVLFMTSFWVRASFGSGGVLYPVRFRISTGIINESFYFWNATLQTMVLVTNVHFSQVIFNTNDVQSSNKYFIVYMTWINDLNGGFIEIPYQFIDNFIMGLTAFQTVDGYCGFQYQWEFTNKTISGKSTFGVEILYSWSLTGTCGFSLSLSSIFYMQTWKCPDPFYYFNLTSGLCQTLCGGFTYQNAQTFTCEPCVDTLCYQCNEPTRNLCTDCAAYLFYQLVNGSCTCMGGYFPTNDICMPCRNASTGCLACSYNDGANGTLPYNSSKFQCLTCNNTANYFLNGALCQLCTMSNCVQCLNLTACTTCITNFFPSVTLRCVRCFVTGCAYCTDSNPNACAICNLTMGYYLSGSTCVTKCGDGIIVSGVQGCDDNNTASFDGCSSTCTVQSSFSCTGAPSTCYFVSSANIALNDTIIQTAVCNTITFIFQITPVTATFAQSYVNWTAFIITPNTSRIIVNTSMIKYSSGRLNVSYYMRTTIQDMTLNFSTNFSSLISNSSIFNQTTSNNLSFVVAPTNGRQALLQCCTGYAFNASINDCSQICGDGRVYDFPCDDGNTISGDGCSSTCQVQTDYVCLNGTNTTASVCCFNGTISVKLNSAIKSPTSNSLSITYTVQPIQPVLVLINNSYNFLPYVSLSNPAAVVTSATYDPSSGTINVQVSYNQSIQGQPLDLTFNPPNVPAASLLPTVASSWTVAPTNRLSAAYYPQSTYNQVSKLQPYSSTILGLYLTLSLITFFFRKYIGLQLATLVQMGYLSLLINNQLPPLLQTVSAWQYVFGYNYFYITKPSSSTTIDSAYSLYGYQKYFGYSCNVMVLAIACVYGLSLILICLSAVTTKSVSRRLSTAGFILLNQVGLSLVTFSTPNIVTAFCIQVREGTLTDTSLLWSKAFLCIGVAAIFLSNIISLMNAEDSSDVGTFFRKHSNFGVYASVLFTLRLILLTVFMFMNESVGSIGSYCLLTIQSFYVIFILFGRPHKKPYDFARSLCIQISLLYILLTRYLQTYILNSSVSADSLLYEMTSIIQLASYGLGVTLSLISLIYHIIKKIKKNKVLPEDNLLQEASPDKVKNTSAAKLQDLSKDGLQQASPSKRRINDQNASSIIFDIEQMETHEVHGSTGKSDFKFDLKKQERKYRRNR